MTNKKLREALLNKLDISPQALWQQCHKLQAQVPMQTEDAVYIIAQRNGIRLNKYLDEETIDRIRGLLQQLAPTTQATVKKTRGKIKDIVAKQRVIKIGKDIKFDDPILPQKKINEAIEMADIYPLIYVLENSAREFIDKIMTAQYGKNWWDLQVPDPLKKDVKKRMSDDEKNLWHQRRGARPIDYLDLKDLPDLMEIIEDSVAPNIIPSAKWFRQLIEEVYKSRCVVCHMNPLDKNNIKAVEVQFNYWEKQISEKKDLIFGQST